MPIMCSCEKLDMILAIPQARGESKGAGLAGPSMNGTAAALRKHEPALARTPTQKQQG